MARKNQSDPAHDQTDAELEVLERRINKIYKEASKEMQKSVDKYFKFFEKRDAAEQERLEAGEISEQQYTQWRLAQMGRGERLEALRDALADRMVKSDEVAMAYVNDDIAKIYALNRSYTIENVSEDFEYLQGINFIQYDEHTVKRLIKDNPNLMPYYPAEKAIARGFDLNYGKQQITASITSSILQGKSLSRTADDLMKRIDTMTRTSALRTARTAMTEAENAGRQDAATELEQMGCIMKKTWLATEDNRTRPAHAEANGQEVDLHDPFEVGGEYLMFPGDQSLGASGWNIYNCRCTRKDKCVGFRSILPEELQGSVQVVD